MKKKLPVLLAISLVTFVAMSLTNCGATFSLLDYIQAPYGYVYASDGTTPVQGATVTVKNSSGQTVQSAATTSATGYWTLTSKVDTTGGTFTISVAKTGYTFTDMKITVPADNYLYNCGSISAQPSAINATVTVNVLDSRSSTHPGVGTVALTLTLASDSTKTYTGTTGTDGAATISSVPNGSYKLTGSKDGYFIAPISVEVSGTTTTVSKVQAFSLNFNDYYGLSFITVWNGTVSDIDAHLTYPLTQTGIGTWSTDLYPAVSANSVAPGTAGDRERIYYSFKHSSTFLTGTQYNAYQDVDCMSGYGPETHNLVDIPGVKSYTTLSGTSPNTITMPATGFDPAVFDATVTYKYAGTAVLYLNAYALSSSAPTVANGANLSSGLKGAEAKVYVIQTLPKTGVTTPTDNTQVQASLLGIYTIPTDTTVASASVVNVNMFRGSNNITYWQVVPHIKLVSTATANRPDGTEFRSLDPAVINPGVVCVRGR